MDTLRPLLPWLRTRQGRLAVAAIVAGGGLTYYYSLAARAKAAQKRLKARPDGGSGKPASGAGGKPSKARGGRPGVQGVQRLLASLRRVGARNVLGLALLAVARTAVSNRLARLQGDLFRAAFLRDAPLFWRLLGQNLLLCGATAGLEATVRYCVSSLALDWRAALTRRLQKAYFANLAYYTLSHVDRRVDNPDQRICEDVPKFTQGAADLAGEVLAALSDGVFYTGRMLAYTGTAAYPLSMLGYVLVAGTVSAALSPPFGRLYAKSQQLEGGYQQLHARLRAQAEPIAFYGGVHREAARLRDKFAALVKHLAGLQRTQFHFGMWQDFCLKYFGATFAVVLIIGPFFGGRMRPDNSVQGRAQMLADMRYHTGVIISLFGAIGTLGASYTKLQRLGAYAGRVGELEVALKALAAEATAAGGGSSAAAFGDAQEIAFENVKITTPAGTNLVENLTLRVKPGTNLLVTGPNGAGKSSLFRVLGGLWPLVEGRILKPGGGSAGLSDQIFYVPQRPYTSIGTLREQIIYPLTPAEAPGGGPSGDELRPLLKEVDLEHLLDRPGGIDSEVNWGELLSLGEQQRLGMARLFFHRPTFAILDECTSAVTTDMEERFTARVVRMGTTCVTISHRPALVAAHDLILALDGEGGWSVHPGHRSDAGATVLASSDAAKAEARGGKLRADDAAACLRGMHALRQAGPLAADGHDAHLGALIAASPAPKLHSSSTALLAAAGAADAPASPGASSRGPASDLRAFGARLRRLMRVLLPSASGRDAQRLALLALVVLARTALSDRIASLNGNSVRHVLRQDKVAFLKLIALSVAQSAASAVVAPLLSYLTVALALSWRRKLTTELDRLYLQRTAFYSVAQLAGIADPNARIVIDADKLCGDLAGLAPSMVKPVVDISWFTWRMYSMTGGRGLAILYAYMGLGFGVLRAITPDFGSLTGEEARLDAAFRFVHTRLRACAESVAFFGGGSLEHRKVDAHLDRVVAHARKLHRTRWLYGLAEEFLTKQLPHNVTWGLSLMYALASSGDRASTDVQGALAHDLRFLASVVSHSFVAFGDILALYQRFQALAGGVARVSELHEALLEEEAAGAGRARRQGPAAAVRPAPAGIVVTAGDEIAFDGADICTPAGRVLARKLTAGVRRGANLLVTGPNGAGKSSLFRVLGGLWPLAGGCIVKPGGRSAGDAATAAGLQDQIFYVPQRPYTALGTLRDQIIYPLTAAEACRACGLERPDGLLDVPALDARLEALLAAVRLSYLCERVGGWEAETEWEERLSLGEQQRLGMARLFFHRPAFGVLDQCTDATSVDVEEALYAQAAALGITLVTISQRPALVQFHQSELRLLDGEGAWELRAIRHREGEA